MQTDPVLEWRRLTEHYRAISDDELREIAEDFSDLTETAQQALRAEMQTRGMGRPEDLSSASYSGNTPQAAADSGDDWTVDADPPAVIDDAANVLGHFGRPPQIVPDAPAAEAADDGPHEYTWKTVLCECNTSEQALQLREALRRARIESWIESAGMGSRYTGVNLTNPRVLVAADQLDQARAIVSQPIPQSIVDDLKLEVPEYEPPVCPKCGARDPVLESVDPENTWECEQCGERWTESAVSGDEEAGQSS
jgi:hypothetical protein